MTTDNQSEEPLAAALPRLLRIEAAAREVALTLRPISIQNPQMLALFEALAETPADRGGHDPDCVLWPQRHSVCWGSPAPHQPTLPVGPSDEPLRTALDWLGEVINAHTDACPILRTASEGGAETDLDTAFFDVRAALDSRDDSAPGEAE